jgi:hypothetical protein
LSTWWRKGLVRVVGLNLLDLVLRWRWRWDWLLLLDELLHLDELSTVSEQMAGLFLVIFLVDVRVQVARSVYLLSEG